jgi:hypothetical protein
MLTKNDGPQWHGPTLVNDPAVELVERHPHSLAARHFCCRTNGSLPAGVQFESGPTDGTPSCSYFWWGYTHKCALIPHIHIIIYLCIHMCIHIYIWYHVYIYMNMYYYYPSLLVRTLCWWSPYFGISVKCVLFCISKSRWVSQRGFKHIEKHQVPLLLLNSGVCLPNK